MRTVAPTAAKVALSLALAWSVARRLDTGDLWGSVIAASPSGLAVAFAAFLLIPALGGLRWWMAMRGLGCRARLCTTSLMFSAACVVGHVLPAVAGDGMRVLLVVRSGQPLQASVVGIVAERAAMLLVLLLLVAATSPAMAVLTGEPRHVPLACGLFVLAVLCGAALLAADRVPPVLARWRRWQRLMNGVPEARRLVFSRWGAGLAACSLASNLTFAVAAFLLGRALGVTATLSDLVVVTPAVMLAAMLPISFGGWGVREGAFAALLGACGVPAAQAVALSLLFGTFGLLAGVPGALAWTWLARRAAGAR